MILPGMGCGDDIIGANWYADCKEKIEQLFQNEGAECHVILQDMPDPFGARESIWIPFVESQLEPQRSCCQNQRSVLVLIGHSSGAQCAMRYIEKHGIDACILISACWTDMNKPKEKRSGYYDRPWNCKQMKQNCPLIIQFGSEDDHLIDYETEQVAVMENLSPIPYMYEDRGHFLTFDVDPDIIQCIQERILKL